MNKESAWLELVGALAIVLGLLLAWLGWTMDHYQADPTLQRNLMRLRFDLASTTTGWSRAVVDASLWCSGIGFCLFFLSKWLAAVARALMFIVCVVAIGACLWLKWS